MKALKHTSFKQLVGNNVAHSAEASYATIGFSSIFKSVLNMHLFNNEECW